MKKATRIVILKLIKERLELCDDYSQDEQHCCADSVGDPVEMLTRAQEAVDWHQGARQLRALLHDIEKYENGKD